MADATPDRPNILFVLCDQLRRDALGCYGDPDARTPNLDRLAAWGVRFTAASSTYPVCVPYRFTLMTGQTAHSRQVPAIDWRMSPTERTLADEFNDGGYDTAYFGKWHLFGGHGTRAMKTPIPRAHQGGWRTFAGFELRNGFFDTAYFENNDPTPVEIEGYQTDGLFDRCMSYLSQQRTATGPFAAVLSVEAPHPPFGAPPELERAWLERDLVLPRNYLRDDSKLDRAFEACVRPRKSPDPERTLRHRKIYHAMVENLDQNIGRLMEHLRREGLEDNTVVVFTSDHGELGGCHNLTEKQFPHEESAGVPLIVSGPGVPGGSVIGDVTCTEDLFPTLLGLAGLKPRDELPGLDLAPLIRKETDAVGRDAVVLEYVSELRPSMVFFDRPWRAVRTGRYKYSVIGGQATGLEPWQLFDLQEDPHEMHDLIDDPAHRDIASDLHGRLRRHMIDSDDDTWLAAAWGHDHLNRYPVLPHQHDGS